MHLYKTVGIVLKTIPFQERDQILTLFTPHHGILKLYAKVRKKSSPQEQALYSPLTEAEYHYHPTRSDLFKLKSGDLLSQHAALRRNYDSLDTALKLTQAVLQFAWPGKSAPKLYALYSIFLKHLHLAHDPSTLYCTFLLKTMWHEGVLHLHPQCLTCGKNLQETHRFAGETFCKEHSPQGALTFSEKEETMLLLLTQIRTFSKVKDLSISPFFQKAVPHLFTQWIENP